MDSEKAIARTPRTSFQSICAGISDRKRISASHNDIPVISRTLLIVSILKTNVIPSTAPVRVPIKPMLAPVSMNLAHHVASCCSHCPHDSNIVPLVFDKHVIEIILNAATRIIRLSIRNMTLRSTSRALKKLLFTSYISHKQMLCRQCQILFPCGLQEDFLGHSGTLL